MTRARLSSFLGAAVILSVPLGPAFRIGFADRGLPVLWAELFGLALVCHLVLSGRPLGRNLRAVGVAGAALFVAATMGPIPVLSIITAKNMLVGAVLGIAIARHVDPRVARRAVLVVAVVTIVQLGWAVADLAEAERHAAANLSWGRSNYIALVAFAWTAGAIAVGPRRAASLWPLVPLGLLIHLTGSRGALLAVLAALVTYLLGNRARSARQFLVRGALVIALLVMAVRVGGDLLAVRAEATNASSNIAARSTLARTALEEFVEHPLTGSGTGGLTQDRDVAGPELDQRYAHSVLPSLLQQFGLLAIPYLVLVLRALRDAYRSGQWLVRPMVLGVAVFACVEIMFEGVLASLFVWWFLDSCIRTAGDRRRALLPPGQPDVHAGVGRRAPAPALAGGGGGQLRGGGAGP